MGWKYWDIPGDCSCQNILLNCWIDSAFLKSWLFLRWMQIHVLENLRISKVTRDAWKAWLLLSFLREDCTMTWGIWTWHHGLKTYRSLRWLWMLEEFESKLKTWGVVSRQQLLPNSRISEVTLTISSWDICKDTTAKQKTFSQESSWSDMLWQWWILILRSECIPLENLLFSFSLFWKIGIFSYYALYEVNAVKRYYKIAVEDGQRKKFWILMLYEEVCLFWTHL